MDLSIIIVNWNVRDSLRNCLNSVYETANALDMEVIVVDNASMDGSVEVVRTEFPDVRVVANQTNLGFPRANNQGIALSKGEFVLLLNPDTLVPEGVLTVSVQRLREKPDVGALGCRLVYPDGTLQPECGRRFLTLWDLISQGFFLNSIFPQSRLFNGYRMGDWDHADEREVDGLSGAFMMLRKEALDQVGALNELMYLEDTEMCHRLKAAGWKVWLLGTQTVIHFGGESSSRSDDPFWLLEGEVRCKEMEILYGKYAVFWCRTIIGVRSLFRCVLGVLLYLPLRLVQKNRRLGNFRRMIHPGRQARLVWWSIRRDRVRRGLPPFMFGLQEDGLQR